MALQAGTLIGVVMLTRHGDRTSFYQDPNSYTGSSTHITPLGEAETYQTGQYIRSRYIASGSSNQISGISEDVISYAQCTVMADAAGEANVIVDSAYSMWQGIYPATPYNNVTLANGTTIVSPLSGQQYLPIVTVEFAQSPLLEAFTSCPTYTSYLAKFYNSTFYSAKAAAVKPFLDTLGPIVQNRSHTLKDMYNVYDYVNVNNIYNTTFADSIANTTVLDQSSDISNWLSYYSFTGPSNSSAGNIAGRGMLGNVISSMQTIANASTSSKIQHYSISYKPFLSVFNMTGAVAADSSLAGLVGYASLLSFELRNVSDSVYVNMVFRNNSAPGTEVTSVPLLGRDQVLMSDFIAAFNSSALYSTLDWCRACNQTSSINNCNGLLVEANATAVALLASGTSNSASTSSAGARTSDDDGSHFSAVGAGFIGAVLGMLVASLGWWLLARRQRKRLVQSRGKVSISSPVQLDEYAASVPASDTKNPFR